MRYNKDFIGLNSILKNVLSKYDLNDLRADEPVLKNWRKIVGEELADYFIPQYQQGEILYVCTTKAAGSRELNVLQKKLVQRINKKWKHPPVKEVKFI